MSTKKSPASPEQLAEWRQIENVQPGHWMWVEYIDNETGRHFGRWAQVTARFSMESVHTGRKAERIFANDTAGYGVDFMQYRGFQVRRLTAAQGRRCELTVPPEPTEET